MRRKPCSRRKRTTTKSVPRLADLEYAKAAVLNVPAGHRSALQFPCLVGKQFCPSDGNSVPTLEHGSTTGRGRDCQSLDLRLACRKDAG
jgi:hypothetical protein